MPGEEKTDYSETKEGWGQEQEAQLRVPEATAGQYFWRWTGMDPFSYLKRAQPLSYVSSLVPNATENLANLSSAILGERGQAFMMLGGSAMVNPRLVPVLMGLGQEYLTYKKTGPRWVQTTLLPAVRNVNELESQRLSQEEEHKHLKEIAEQLSKRMEALKQALATPPTDKQFAQQLKLEHVDVVKKYELAANKLKKMGSQLAKTTQELKAAQVEAQKQIEQVDSQTFQVAEDIYQTLLMDNPTNYGNLDHATIKKAVDAVWKNPRIRDNFINEDKVLFLVSSRLAIKDADDKLASSNTTKRVAYLVPVHKEFNRLKPISECITGENFRLLASSR